MKGECTLTTPVWSWVEDVYTRSNFSSPIFKSFDISEPKSTPLASEQYTCFSSMEGLGRQYFAVLSGQTIELNKSRRRRGTLYPYKTGWHKWSSWCLLRKINPVSAGVNFRLEFLSNLFSK